jgi:GMP synthase-like glutamine amidotransferase
MPSTDQTAQPAAWPEGVVARYATVGGAHVNMTHRLTVHNPPEPFATLAACTGCPASEEVNHYRLVWGLTAQHEEHHPEAADRDAREWAQAHAEKCRALPRPTA